MQYHVISQSCDCQHVKEIGRAVLQIYCSLLLPLLLVLLLILLPVCVSTK